MKEKKIKRWKRYQVMMFLAAIAIGMGVIKIWAMGRKEEIVETAGLITPTVTIAPTPTINQFESDYPLWEILPYQGKGFVVEKYIEAKTLKATVKGVNKKTAEEEMKKWLELEKVGDHKVEWE